MELKRFTIGMRFAMTPFSDLTPKTAWEQLLSRIPAKMVQGLNLFGVWDSNPEMGPEQAYICIFSNASLKRAKALFELLEEDSDLCACLTAFQPFVQNNALERYTELEFLGIVAKDGTVLDGQVSFESMTFHGPELAKTTQNRKRILVMADGTVGELPAFDCCRLLSRCAAEIYQNAFVRWMPVSNGREGTLDTLVCANCGRYDVLQDGQTRFGILPDHSVVLEALSASTEQLDAWSREIRGKGYRRLLLSASQPNFQQITIPEGLEINILSPELALAEERRLAQLLKEASLVLFASDCKTEESIGQMETHLSAGQRERATFACLLERNGKFWMRINGKEAVELTEQKLPDAIRELVKQSKENK